MNKHPFLTLLVTISLYGSTACGAVAESHPWSRESIIPATPLELVDASAAEQLVGDCAALLVLDEAAFDAACGAAPTILSQFIEAVEASPVPADAGLDSGRGPPPERDSGEPGEPAGSEMPAVGAEAAAVRGPPSLDVLRSRLDAPARRLVPDGFTRAVDAEVPEHLARHHARMVELLSGRIETASREFAEAAYEGSLRRLVRNEARLTLIHERLQTSFGPLPAALEDNPYALMSDAALRAGVVELSRVDRILAESLILFSGDPALGVARQGVGEMLSRLRRAAGTPSAERSLPGLDDDRISDILREVEAALPDAERSAMAIAREQFDPLGVTLDNWRGPRGPPADSRFPRSARLLDAIEQIFDNPTRFVRDMSSLRAEHAESYAALREAPARVRERWSFGADDYQRWILAQMSGADLARLRVTIARVRPAVQMLAGWSEFGAELAELARSAETEQDWRAPGSGRGDHPPGYPPDDAPALRRVAERYHPEALAIRPRTAQELQFHVHTLIEMFPRREAMPAALADDLLGMLNERLTVEFRRVEEIVQAVSGPDGLNERAARAMIAQDPAVLAALQDAKRHAEAAVAAMRERVALLEHAEIVRPQPERWDRMDRWSVRLGRPPPRREAVDSQLGLPAIDRAPAGAIAYRELRLDARLLRAESALVAADERLALASPLLSADIQASPVGGEQGRAVVSDSAPATDAASLARQIEQPYPRTTRYPADLTEWTGLFDRNGPERKPLDFKTYVVDLQNFRGLGGGIHFGSHAEPDPDARRLLEGGAHLYYAADTRHLTLMLPSGERFAYGPVEPRVLKSLYSYVTSYPGINLAISIGAVGEEEYAPEHNQQPVLLDPAFVDTPVGQALYLADRLPWALDEPKLPNGAGNPVSAFFDIFRTAHKDRLTIALQSYLPERKEPSEIELTMASRVFRNLAVLFDQRVRFGMVAGRIRLDAQMRYRYVEPDFKVSGGKLVLHRDVDDPLESPRARDIPGLGEIATMGFDRIAAVFEPLAKVREYAGLAALLRWAACAPESGDVCMARPSVSIDLSALGAFDMRDRKATPTPDAIRK